MVLDGFLLAENKDDNTKLDHLITPLLTQSQKNLLGEHGYLGDYTLDAKGICYRTQVALRCTFTSAKKMQQFLAGTCDEEEDDAKVYAKCKSILRGYQVEIQAKLLELKESGELAARAELVMRWEQILAMVEMVLSH